MKVWVIVDHICDADIIVAVFSSAELANGFMEAHKNDWDGYMRKYEGLEAQELTLDLSPA